ncbi:hypothetical protein ACKKBG_A29875 [Auxenochlorella protothecoides x Auxenochlorella symbiontica]
MTYYNPPSGHAWVARGIGEPVSHPALRQLVEGALCELAVLLQEESRAPRAAVGWVMCRERDPRVPNAATQHARLHIPYLKNWKSASTLREEPLSAATRPPREALFTRTPPEELRSPDSHHAPPSTAWPDLLRGFHPFKREDMLLEENPPLGFSWRAKRVRTGLPEHPRTGEPSLIPRAAPAPVVALAASAKSPNQGLLALCEAASSAGNDDGEPSSTSTVSAPGLQGPPGNPGPPPVLIKSVTASPFPGTPTSRGPGPGVLLTKKKTAAYIGVRRRPWGSYAAEIRNQITGAREWLGTFETAEEAAVVYDIRKRQIKGEATKCNFPPLKNNGLVVEREICPHGQSAPERLILQVPADWAAQIAPSVRGPGAAAPAVQGLKHESSLGREGTLGMSPCSAFRALRDVASSELGNPTDPHGPALALD